MALGADVNLPDANHNSALLQSVMNIHLDTSDILISFGANEKGPRIQKAVCDSYSKWYSQNKLKQCKDLVECFRNLIGIEVFYNHMMLEAIKEGYQYEYIMHMDNSYGTDCII